MAERSAARTTGSNAIKGGGGSGSGGQAAEAGESVAVDMSRIQVLRKEQARLRFEYERMEAKLLEMEAKLLEKERLEGGDNSSGAAARPVARAAPPAASSGFASEPEAGTGGSGSIPPGAPGLPKEDGSLVFNLDHLRWVFPR